MSDPNFPLKGWTPERVRQHLQNALYVEMWTIPLYLTAAYSIKVPLNPNMSRPEFAPVPTKEDGTPDFARFSQKDYNQFAFNSVLSVAIQEMLHAELAANLINAVSDGQTPQFTGEYAPHYQSAPKCLKKARLPEGVQLRLGPLDENQARLFQWIEHEDPLPSGDPEAYAPAYSSIGDFYTSLSFGMKVCWPELYPPKGLGPAPTADQLRQKDDWGSMATAALQNRSLKSGFLQYFLFGHDLGTAANATASDALAEAGQYGFSIKIYGSFLEGWTRAEAAMTAIRVQGEGAGAGQDIPTKFRPTEGDEIEIVLDRISHWQRFTEILRLVQAGT
ncbi:MAG: ferritin-like protein, partial [Armatimonadota bacterium]|nr:ferritin-like protein [Armatimonadota bacterium]